MKRRYVIDIAEHNESERMCKLNVSVRWAGKFSR